MNGYLKRTQLVIAIDKSGLTIASLLKSSGHNEIAREQRFALPQSIDWQSPGIGKTLTEFLRENNWQSNNAILSLSADFCLFRQLTLPPLADHSLASAIAIQAERQFAGNDNSFAMDYTSVISTKQGSQTLLAATPQSLLQAIVNGLAAGGVKVSSVLPGILAMVDQSQAEDGMSITVHITDNYAELSVFNNQQITAITSVTFSDDDMPGAVAGELNQIAIMLPTIGEQQPIVRVYNDSTVDDKLLQGIIENQKLQCDLQPRPGGQQSTSHAVNAIVVLADSKKTLPIDFLHSRLVEAKPKRFGQNSRLAVVAIVAIILAILSFVWDIASTKSNIAQLSQQLTEISPDLERAKQIIDRTVYARRWFSRQPRHLECQKTLADAFGYDNQTWATSIAIRDDLTGLITGNALSERNVLELLDRLKSQDEMQSVKLVYVRESAGRSKDVGFAIRFKYVASRSES